MYLCLPVSCVYFMYLVYILGFYAFQSVVFATIYNTSLYVIHRSYFISGCGEGNKMIDPYVILAMPFNF